MDEWFWKEERPSGPIPFQEDIEEGPCKALRFFHCIVVILSRLLSAGSDGRDIFEMFGNLPVEIEVSKDCLTSTGDRLLREFEDHHLRQLFEVPIRHAHQIGSKEEIYSIPANGSGKVALKGGGKLHHMGQEHFRMFGRFGHGNGVGKAQTKPFDIFEGLSAAVRPIRTTQIMERNIASHMGIRSLL